MSSVDGGAKLFEDFMPGKGDRDILRKVKGLERYMRERSPAYLAGLGLQMLGPAEHNTSIRERDGRTHDVIMLGSNSYFSLTTHPDVVRASKESVDKYGYGMGAVSLYAGTTDLHRELEAKIAEFYGAEDAILFPSGYSANVGTISALCGPGDTVVNDLYNHASIFDGCRLSGARIEAYKHCSVSHLRRTLSRLSPREGGVLVITDGVFSMDGDIAPLDGILEAAEEYDARVMIDEAHALGVVGPTGRGSAEAKGCLGRVDVTVGTLSKAPGGMGGYCVGSRALISYLRYYARAYFFSTSIPAPVVAGLIEVFKLLAKDNAGRERLWENVVYLRDALRSLGFNLGNTASAIIPVIIGDERKLAEFQTRLRDGGVFTNLVTFPAVKRKACRLRLSVMSALTREELDTVIGAMTDIGRDLGVIG